MRHALHHGLIRAFFAGACLLAMTARSAEVAIGSADELADAMKSAKPGDVLVMSVDADWRDQQLEFAGRGTEATPITLRAERPGEVILTGTAMLRISGEWLVVDGLRFETDQPDNSSHIVQFRGELGDASNCRLTNTALIRCNPDDPATRYFWVSLYGQDNRVDHCRLEGMNHSGVTLCVWLDGRPARHRIDHNHFVDRAPGDGNGFEGIRIGTSDYSRSNAEVRVENNRFERIDGEMEIISSKANGNVFRKNVFVECAGTLTLRHGRDCLVESNIFLGNGKERTGGVRVIGQGHRVIGNTFVRIDDRADGAISIASGIPDTPLNGYDAPGRISIEGNRFVDLAGPPIKADWGYGQRNRRLLADDVIVRGNIVNPPTSLFIEGRQGEKWQVENNVGDDASHIPSSSIDSIEHTAREAQTAARQRVGPAWWADN